MLSYTTFQKFGVSKINFILFFLILIIINLTTAVLLDSLLETNRE